LMLVRFLFSHSPSSLRILRLLPEVLTMSQGVPVTRDPLTFPFRILPLGGEVIPRYFCDGGAR
jgi:hypothetical protein